MSWAIGLGIPPVRSEGERLIRFGAPGLRVSHLSAAEAFDLGIITSRSKRRPVVLTRHSLGVRRLAVVLGAASDRAHFIAHPASQSENLLQ